MKIVFFVHSVVSDWNHGNAHFLRGLMSALADEGHRVVSYEPRGAWALENLLEDHGVAPVVQFARSFPEIEVGSYDPAEVLRGDAADGLVAGADLVVVHEWNEPPVADRIAAAARRAGAVVLFHDTHHRPWSEPQQIARFDLTRYDAVLAFGDVLRDIYRERFGVRRAFTLHEAADVLRFRPLDLPKTQDVAWIGNWGDGERSTELRAFWLSTAMRHPELRWTAYGVRYSAGALRDLRTAGVEYLGWAPSLDVPEIFSRSRVTLHVPRRAYVQALAGIPTIRVFEALACGVPLVCAPWHDAEGLFRPGDYRVAATPAEMEAELLRMVRDPEAAARQAERGLETILRRHTCGHRAEELLDIVNRVAGAGSAGTLQAEAACT